MKKKVLEIQTFIELEKDRKIVGVDFIQTRNEYEDCDLDEATHQMFFCMMVKAATIGHGMKVTKKHIYCSAASEVLGFSMPNEDVKSGKRQYERNMYCSEKIAQYVAEGTPYLNHSVYGMVIQPLEKYEKLPDVVMIFCKPYTAMRIIQSYTYYFGYAKNIIFSGMGGVCSELMARSYKNQDINVSFLCSGTRFASEWRDCEVGIAFPGKMLDAILDGLRNTLNTFEPDDKKQYIDLRAKENDVEVDLDFGNNYHESSIGVAKLGVKGYRRKKTLRKKDF